jgi:hypothetical protein
MLFYVMKMRFNIAGAFSKSEQLLMFFVRNKTVLSKFDITVYDGISRCKWNGGRINRDIDYTDDVIDFYYRNNISIALTFTNPVIDCKDSLGNELLKKFHRPGNVIITVNDDLQKYIKDNFPHFKHTRSITSFGKINVPMSQEDFDHYKELEQRYDFIVPRSEHVFDSKFKNLNLSKYEMMLNDTCVYNCPYYGEHFAKIAEQNILHDNPWDNKKQMYEIEECWLSERSTYLKSSKFNPDTGHQPTIKKYGDNYGMELNTEQINRLAAQGVRSFKISGREMEYEDFEHELNSYLKVDYEETS